MTFAWDKWLAAAWDRWAFRQRQAKRRQGVQYDGDQVFEDLQIVLYEKLVDQGRQAIQQQQQAVQQQGQRVQGGEGGSQGGPMAA